MKVTVQYRSMEIVVIWEIKSGEAMTRIVDKASVHVSLILSEDDPQAAGVYVFNFLNHVKQWDYTSEVDNKKDCKICYCGRDRPRIESGDEPEKFVHLRTIVLRDLVSGNCSQIRSFFMMYMGPVKTVGEVSDWTVVGVVWLQYVYGGGVKDGIT
ncbi:Uncharacterized protein Fot_00341 [Forsythia ovata]|uniref:Uncharacterized protein n=1 Tax=Forsythia ovata TaxID=205694 RepID=A0ABD1X1F7_9LAMI